jgi:membrane protein required for colicin V production
MRSAPRPSPTAAAAAIAITPKITQRLIAICFLRYKDKHCRAFLKKIVFSCKILFAMNLFDILIGLLLAWAVVAGFRKGLVRQLCGIAGIVLGVWLAFRLGRTVGERLLSGGEGARIIGFVVVVVVVTVGCAALGRLLSRLIKITGLGLPDRIGGTLLSTAGMLVIASVMLVCFDAVDSHWRMVEPETKNRSTLYYPVLRLSGKIFPAVGDARRELLGE